MKQVLKTASPEGQLLSNKLFYAFDRMYMYNLHKNTKPNRYIQDVFTVWDGKGQGNMLINWHIKIRCALNSKSNSTQNVLIVSEPAIEMYRKILFIERDSVIWSHHTNGIENKRVYVATRFFFIIFLIFFLLVWKINIKDTRYEHIIIKLAALLDLAFVWTILEYVKW